MIDSELRFVDRLEIEFDGGLDAGVFIFDFCYIFVESYADVFLALGAYAEDGMCCARNSVAEVAAVDFSKSDFVFEAETV